MNKKWNRRDLILFLLSLFFLGGAVILQVLARTVNGFAQWYASWIYPVIVGTVGRLFGMFPFSVIEIGIYGVLIATVIRCFKRSQGWKHLLVRVLFAVTSIFLIFTLNCGINYYRNPFSSYLNLEIHHSPADELADLCLALTERLNDMGRQGIDAAMSCQEAEAEGVKAMNKLGETYPSLAGYYPKPKGLLWSYLFSVQQLCGEYSPFTVEANYNRDMPDYNIPHTISHELSHLRGFMREDEANFIGYLACISSDSRQYQYSGYLTGWVYATNALAKIDMIRYQEICGKLDEEIWKDLRQNNEFWGRYEGKAAEVSNQLNDAYLKINNQADGVKSYGRMVDLMLAYERQEKGANIR